MTLDYEASIIRVWKQNAKPWINAVREQGIRDPGTVSRDALIATIEDHAQSRCQVLDVGCGEGWLADELAGRGFSVTGVDASEELIHFAQKNRRGEFIVGDQASLKHRNFKQFGMLVCNFSLFGDLSVSRFVSSVPELLLPGGLLIIQTLHPFLFYGSKQSATGWYTGTWAGLPGDFGEPPPIFVRSLENWSDLFRASGLSVQRLIEPSVSEGTAASLIFVVSNGESNDCAA